jgi:hypothetical protein
MEYSPFSGFDSKDGQRIPCVYQAQIFFKMVRKDSSIPYPVHVECNIHPHTYSFKIFFYFTFHSTPESLKRCLPF